MSIRSRSRLSLRASCFAILLATAVMGIELQEARSQEEGPPADLQGILPDYIPDGLTEGDFNELGGNWAEWAATTGRLVSDFYASDDDTVRARRQTLAQIEGKLGTLEAALNDPRYLSIYGTLADLYGRLSRRIGVAGAVLATLDRASIETADPVRDAAGQLLMALEEYETEPTSENMEAVRQFFDDLRRLSPDGAPALTVAMRHHYLNYNLRVVMDETLIQDLLHDTRMESGYINDMISGARVTGCQWTNTTVNVDLKPSQTAARLDLILNGTVRSSAQGETHVATVYTTGRHSFSARKSVVFDGDRFQHWCAAVRVGGGSCPYAAQTCISWAPLLGGVSENLVLKVANDRLPESNAYSINKIRREVGTQFDRETGNMLQEAELALEERVAGPLREGGYYPDIKEFRTTETELLMRSRLMESGEVAGSQPIPFPIYPAHGALVQVHESLLNQVGDRLELNGKRFTPEGLKEYLRTELESITGQPVDVDLSGTDGAPDSPEVEEIIFHDADAVRFQIRRGEVVLILSMGLKLEGRDEIPPQRISVPLNFSLAGDKIVMDRGTVGVSPIGPVPPRERAQQIARAGVMRSKIQEAFEPRDFDSIFTMDVGEKQVTLQITQLRARAGWLSVIATDGISELPESFDVPTAGKSVQYARDQGETTTR